MHESSTRSKMLHFQGYLEMGQVRVWFETDRLGVQVPPVLRTRSFVELRYTPDALPKTTSQGVSAVIVIGKAAFPTVVPWTAIFYMASDRGEVSWWEDASPETRDSLDPILMERQAEYWDAAAVYAAGLKLAKGAPGGMAAIEQPVSARSPPADTDEPPAEEAAPSGRLQPRASSPSLVCLTGGAKGSRDEGDDD